MQYHGCFISAVPRRLREEVEEHSAYTNASAGHCVRRTEPPSYTHRPLLLLLILILVLLLRFVSSSPRLTTTSALGREVYGERGRKRDRKRMGHDAGERGTMGRRGEGSKEEEERQAR